VQTKHPQEHQDYPGSDCPLGQPYIQPKNPPRAAFFDLERMITVHQLHPQLQAFFQDSKSYFKITAFPLSKLFWRNNSIMRI